MKLGFGVTLGLSVCLASIACSGDPGPRIADEAPPARAPARDDVVADVSPNGAEPSQACAKVVAKSDLAPVDLVFAFDRSGSMSDQGKWDACSAGLRAFFANPATHGFRAALQYFPLTLDWCSATRYATPAVGMTTLPDATKLATSIDGTSPISDRGTPTLPALEGAFQYAEAVLAAEPTHRVAVVLVTDGEPRDCGSTVDGVSARAAAARARIPTFVVGVGGNQSLDILAFNGGTDKAIVVDTQDPTKTGDAMRDALAKVQGTLGCDFAIPDAGTPVDPSKVNVMLTLAGTPSSLAYDEACSPSGGWHYDSPANPGRIVLCPSTCGEARASTNARLEVVFGCATKRVK